MVSKNKLRFFALPANTVIITICWIIINLAFITWNVYIEREHTKEAAKIKAIEAFNKDLAFRSWATSHGGVYVPPDEKTPPNPYLGHIHDRDILTTSGKKLTLMNPAYLMRQTMEDYEQLYGIKGHITSLKTLNPMNAPDVWQRKALVKFDRGEDEISEIVEIDGKKYMRLMRPMITQKGCLKCHEQQGYKEGDVRGGIGVSVPMDSFLVQQQKHINTYLLTDGVVFLIGLIAIAFACYRNNRSQQKIINQQYFLEKAQELGQIGTWELNLEQNRLVWTDENCKIFGVPPGSVLSYELFLEKIHPEDREYVDQEWKAALEGKSYDIEHRIIVDGCTKWVREKAEISFDTNGKAVNAIGFTQDITERKQADDKMGEAENNYHTLADFAYDMETWENPDNTFRYVSPSCERITGYSAERFYDNPHFLREIIVPEDLPVWDAHHTERHEATTQREIQFRIKRSDGQVRWIEHVCQSVHDDKKNYRGTRGCDRDITESKRADAALRDAHLQQQEAVKAANIGLWDWDLLTDKVHYSTEWKSQLGYEEHEILDNLEEWKSRVYPEDLDSILKYFQRCIAEARQDFEVKFRFRHRDGSYRLILSQGSIFLDNTGQAVRMLGSHIDITERELSEKVQSIQLRLIEYSANHTIKELLQKILGEAELLTYSKIGFYHFLSDDQTTLSLQTWSTNTLENICKAEGEDMHYPVSKAGVWVDCIRERRAIVHNDYESLPHKKGFPEGHASVVRELLVPVFRSNKIVAILGLGNKGIDYDKEDVKIVQQLADMAWEIVIRKRAEEERNRLATAVEQTEEIILITDSEGIIEYVNHAFEYITGHPRQEVIGKKPSILKSGKQPDEIYHELWDIIRNGGVWRGCFVNKKKDGSLYNEESTITPIKNMEGTIINYVAVKRDISKEKKMEEQLRQAQKMESIGTLAGGIAHDFNNILGVITGHTELSLDDVEDRPEAFKSLQQVLEASNRAKDLVCQILTFSRSTDIDKKPIKTIPIVKEVFKFLRSSLPTTIELILNISAKRDLIMADSTQFHQILMNLCTNAGHAMKDSGGKLEVLLEEFSLTENDLMIYTDLKIGSYLKLIVKDTGYGISGEHLENIFEPYFTTKGKGEGTGLGLAVVHGIVKDYGGDIRVYSDIGKGTVFQVLLPLIAQDTVPYLMKTPVPLPTGTEVILFVDDEKSLVGLVKRMLGKLGYKVVGITSAVEAIETFQLGQDAYDLVITDKTMPGMTGFGLAEEIKKIRTDIPIILCTGAAEKTDAAQIKNSGIDVVIMKPFNRQILAETVRKVLDRRMSKNI